MKSCLLAGLLLVIALGCANSQTGPIQAPPAKPELALKPTRDQDQEWLRSAIEVLTGDELGGRLAGSPEGKATAEYLAGEFKRFNLTAFDQTPNYLQSFSAHGKSLQNVAGYWPGSDAQLKGEAIIIGAHYDHLGRTKDNSAIYRGADDNASGVAAVLNLAAGISQAGSRLINRTVIFLVFDGEETGLLGSTYYTQHPLWPIDKTVFMLNLDTIGRPVDNKLYVSGSASSPGIKDILNKQNSSNFDLVFQDIPGGSDYVSFLTAKIPSYFFFTGAHSDYHQTTDTPDKLDLAALSRVTKLAKLLVTKIAYETARPEFRDMPISVMPASQGEKKKSSLGMMPDFSGSPKGFLVGGAGKNSPAAAAGIQKGDIVLSIDGQPIKDLKDLSDFLNAHQPGDTVTIIYLRGDQQLSGQAVLKERMMQ